MARKITIKLDTARYREPTQEDLEAAKRFVLRREGAVDGVCARAEDLVKEAAVDLVGIAYRYNISPEEFSFDSSVDEAMMEEVAAVMDELEEELFSEIEAYSIGDGHSGGVQALLMGFLLSLGHRNMGMRNTVHEYLWRTLRQTEAMIAAAKAAGRTAAQASSAVRSSLENVQGSSLMRNISRYRQMYRSQFIRNGGHATFSDGSPNVQGVPTSGLTAILRVASEAVRQTREYAHDIEMQQSGAIGYWQFRGSDYPCDLCDEEVGFHEFGDMEYDPMPHCHCCCGRLPIYKKEELENMSEYGT